MKKIVTNFLFFTLIVCILITQTACEDNKKQREQFINILNENFMKPNAVSIELDSKLKKDIGKKYFEQLEILFNFNNELFYMINMETSKLEDLDFESVLTPDQAKYFAETNQQLNISIENKKNFENILANINGVIEKNTIKISALNQDEDDLKNIYNQAVEKAILQPSNLAKKNYSILIKIIDNNIALLNLINNEKNSITLNEQENLVSKDKNISKKINELFEINNKLNDDLEELQVEMNNLLF